MRIPSLQLEQVLFMETWKRAGGSAFLLLQVERTYLLLCAPLTRKIYERAALRTDVETGALARGDHRFPTPRMIRALTHG